MSYGLGRIPSPFDGRDLRLEDFLEDTSDPVAKAVALLKKSYNLDTINLPRYGGQFKDTVTVTPDTGYCFMTRIMHNVGDSTQFDSANGCYVLMRDTVRPVNSLVLSNRRNFASGEIFFRP